jgi:hypothetical protein
MAMPVEQLEAEVLRLSTPDRVRLLDRVIASLDADKARDAAWDQLAAERQAQIASGQAVVLPSDKFVARLRADLT